MSVLIHRCDIYSISQNTSDAYNNSVDVETLLHQGIACRLVEKTQTIYTDNIARAAPTKQYVLLLPKRATVQEGYVVKNIRTRGSLHNAGPFAILSIIHHSGMSQRHSSVNLEYIGTDG